MIEQAEQSTTIEQLQGVELDRRTFLLLSILGVAAVAGCTPEREKKTDVFADTPSWEQDFTQMPNGSPDPNVWRITLGPDGSDNGGDQVYTSHPENVVIRNGALFITALEQKIEGHPYSSARIDTLGHASFGYGRLVIRAQMPTGVGPHAAGWMRLVTPDGASSSTDPYGEIDIFEHVGINGERIYNNLHTSATVAGDTNGLSINDDGTAVPGCTDRMVDYGIERTEAGILFTIDGKPAGTIVPPVPGGERSWPFTAADKYYLILNMAVGDTWGGKSGVDTKSDPWQMQVESIKFFPVAA